LIQAQSQAVYGKEMTGQDQAALAVSAANQRDLFKRIRTKDICLVTRQLSTLLKAGMPLVPALSALVDQLRCPGPMRQRFIQTGMDSLASIMEQVRRRVNEGESLSHALARYPAIFSPLFTSLISAGETGGTLEQTRQQLAKMLEKRVRLGAKIKAAVAYPVMMTLVAAGVVMFLLGHVVPSITKIFAEMNRGLPQPTLWLISISDFVQHYFVFIILAMVAAGVGMTVLLRSPRGRAAKDRTLLKLPLVRDFVLKLQIARLTRTLGTLLTGGVPILRALAISRGVIQNQVIQQAWREVEEAVRGGEPLAKAIRGTGQFPPLVYHVIATGQVSGNIEEGLMDIAEMYDNEIEITTKTLSSLLEPAILLVMGAIIGFIVLAILLPIFDINQTL
jgi:general secretion pathway protein F